MDRWRGMLIDARRTRALSRPQLASLAGISVEALRGYEVGRRRPKAESLDAILAALDLDPVPANAIREAAGFAPVRTLYGDLPGYSFSVRELQSVVEQVEWPQFVTNTDMELVAANRALCALWHMPPFPPEHRRRPPPPRHLLAVTLQHQLYRYIANWDELVGWIAGLIKGRPIPLKGPLEARVYLEHVLPHVHGLDRAVREQFLAAWVSAEPRPAKVRWSYRISWQDPEAGRMDFNCFASTANESEGLEFNDWIPVGARSWRSLARLAPPP